MNRERIESLWSRYLTGESLSPEEKLELRQGLEEHADLQAEFFEDKQLHGLLGALDLGEQEGESFGRAFQERLSLEQDANNFARKVRSRIEDLGPEPRDGDRGAPPPGPGQKRTLRPSGRMRRGSGMGRRFFWKLCLIAAGILLAVVGILALQSPGPGSDRQDATARREKEKSAEAKGQAKLEEGRRSETEKVRKEAEERVSRLREEERRAEEAKRLAPDEDLRKKADEAFAEIARKRKEEEERLAFLRRMEEEARRILVKTPPEPAPQEKPADPGPVKPLDAAPRKPGTEVVVARVERVEGKVNIVSVSGKRAAKGGEDILPDQGLEASGPNSFAVLVYPDRTRLEAGPNTELQELKAEGQKRVHVAKGEIRGVVSRQPKDEAMVFTFRDGEATVLGTTLRIAIDPDPKKGTRLDVEEGKVRLKNLAGKTVLVESGHYAVATVGVELTSKRYVNLLVDPGFEGGGKAWLVQSDPASVTVVGSRARSGSRALQLTRDPQAKRRVIQDVAVRPGTSYEVSVWMWSETAAGAMVTLMWLGATDNRIAPEVVLDAPQGARSWGRSTGRHAAPAGAIRLRLELLTDVSTGTVWIDDCEVCPVER